MKYNAERNNKGTPSPYDTHEGLKHYWVSYGDALFRTSTKRPRIHGRVPRPGRRNLHVNFYATLRPVSYRLVRSRDFTREGLKLGTAPWRTRATLNAHAG